MYILIEHNGSPEHLAFAKNIQQVLEDDFGATTEQIIGHNDRVVTLYSEELKPITELSPSADLSVLTYYMTNYYEDEL
jgi:hypothetical protein